MSTAKRWAEDLRTWFSSLRFSGFTVIVAVLVVMGALIISPSLSTLVQQQREIADLRESVRQHREAVDEMDESRAKWKDPIYIRSQARDRLYYVMPGETQLNVIDDVVIPEDSDENTSADLTQIDQNWVETLVGSVLTAGTTDEPAPDANDTGDGAAENPDADATDPESTPDAGEENSGAEE
ncbi:FtsB family cell division protein [Leucobacter sp. GX24907]